MKHPLFVKLAALAAVVLLLLIGLGLVADVVHDRQRYRSLTAQSVADSLAGPQTLVGPLIHSACVESWDAETGKGDERRLVEQRREFRLTAMPELLRVQSTAGMEERARGLHRVQAFNLQAQVQARWASLASLQPRATVKNSRIQCGAPILMMGVSDARGIRMARLTLGDETPVALKPGTFHPVYSRGLHATLPEALRGRTEGLAVVLDLELVGTERVAIVPLGDSTEVQLASGWPHPSFGGRFLPADREVRSDGFTARWRLSSLATTAQADVAEGKRLCAAGAEAQPGELADLAYPSPQGECADSFSAAFVDPVNPYTLSDRATKYGVLFIALTFVAVGLVELMGRGPGGVPLRVHPVQYLLVGSALCSFFLLLVALSEHLAFGAAYAIAAAACVLLLGHYASHVLGGARRGLPLAAGMALLYGLLYVLLQLEQTALAVGAVALFLVLAAVMVLTRKVNWYGLAAGSPAPTPAPTGPGALTHPGVAA